MIEANEITYRVRDRELISGVSVSFAPGRLNLIIGPNGAGKSTLIRLLSRSLRPQSGTIRFGGVDIANSKESDLARSRAVLSQAVEIAFPLSVRDVVMMGRYPHFGGRPGPTDDDIVAEMLRYFDLTQFADRYYQTLSGGERQRVNFARVLAQLWESGRGPSLPFPCRYLFLDEPLTFLDIRHQIDFMKKVKEFSSGSDIVTVGVVHDLNLAARFADEIVLIDKGRIFASGDPAEVLTPENFRDVFGVVPTFVRSPEAEELHFIFN